MLLRTAWMSGVGLLIVATMGVPSAAAKETFDVTITYVLEPSQKLPEGVTSVAILDDNQKVEMSGDDARAKKWAKICADMMEQMVLDSKQKLGGTINLAKRRETGKVMAENDLKASGLAEGKADTKLAGTQALIVSQLNVQVETNKSKKSTIDITSIAGGGGWHSGFGSGTASAREADAISRNLTLQCKFSMMDSATSQALFEYAPKPYRKMDSKKPGAVYGRSKGEADLDPVDSYIGELVEEGTREFVSTFAPVQVEYSYELEASSNKDSAAGVRALRADDYETAMAAFKKAVGKNGDDHKSLFALGVTCELMHDWDTALKYYRQAASAPKLSKEEQEKYLAAKDRVSSQKDRIRKPKKG